MSKTITLSLSENQLAALMSMAEHGIDDRSTYIGECREADGFSTEDIEAINNEIKLAQATLAEAKERLLAASNEAGQSSPERMSIGFLITLDVEPNDYSFNQHDPREMTAAEVEEALSQSLHHIIGEYGINEGCLADTSPMAIEAYEIRHTLLVNPA
ncbi:hypothetical protein [Marinobacter sp. MBR-105]|jgi:hypothetical protein